MAKLSKLECTNCGHLNNRNRGKCDRCNESIGYGYPNVNIFADQYYTEALAKRYQEAIRICQEAGKRNFISEFEQMVQEKSKAVINMDNSLLFELVNNQEHYLPYRRAVEQGKRLIDNIFNDPKRTFIDSCFYGIHGGDIVFAALSLDDNGLTSYGDVSVVLNMSLTKKRISVFEKNSFLLYDELTKNNSWDPSNFPPPPGYFAIWDNRLHLAMAKCYSKIINIENEGDHCSIILFSTGDRLSDDFIELHIYDKITYFQFQKVKFQRKLIQNRNLISLRIAEEKLEEAGIELEII